MRLCCSPDESIEADRKEHGVLSLIYEVMFLVICLLLISAAGLGNDEKSLQEVVLRGKVICVDEKGSEVPCGQANPHFALKTDEGQTFKFLPEDPNSRMFEDYRVRQRRLQIRGWLKSQNRIEIIKVYSLKGDQLFDIYYFCQTCNIKAFVGGLCWCCQKEFELKETPVCSE